MADQNDIVFLPLGGVGEIGMNLSLYGLGRGNRRKWLAVDLGVSFGDEERLPGIDLIMPDIRFLEAERKNLVGIVLTHAHEDHFGALLDLWPRLNVPVYATPFSAALLEAKCAAEREAPKIDLRVVPVGGRVNVGAFDVEFVPVAHSIPEAHALAIRTDAGLVLHTGDWKLDPTPMTLPPTDEARLRQLGDEGVMALIGDSTNAVRDGRSPSERDVAASLKDIIAAARGRVAVTTFASNVGRIRAVAEAAQACGREVLLVGRAMERVAQVARETGHLDGVPEFRSADMFARLPPHRVVALCTGSQGEPRAALARIVSDDHPLIRLAHGDTVIFSSRTIPGNEKAVGRIVNGLIELGAHVITDRTHFVHVSGHPRRDELRDLLAWTKPRLVVPAHGEALHLAEHAALAREAGVPDVLRCRNGDVVLLGPGEARIMDEAPAGRLYKDGLILIDEKDGAVAERRKLSYAGLIAIAIAIDEKGEMLDDPQVTALGLPSKGRGGENLSELIEDIAGDTFDQLPRARRRDPDAVAEAIRRAVRAAIAGAWGKKPNCVVQVSVV